MKSTFTILIAVALSLLAGHFVFNKGGSTTTAAKETAYERVMRTGTIRCGYFIWPPYYNFNSETKQISGLQNDLVQSVFKKLNIKVEFVESLLGQEVADLENNKIDAHCFFGPIVTNSLKYLKTSTPFYYVPAYVYVHDTSKFNDYNDLNKPNVNFVALDGDISLTLAQKFFSNAKIQTRPSSQMPTQLMLDVVSGKADAFIMEPSAANSFNSQNENKLYQVKGKTLYVYPIQIATSANDQQLHHGISQTIDLMIKNGEIENILKEYDPSGTHFIIEK